MLQKPKTFKEFKEQEQFIGEKDDQKKVIQQILADDFETDESMRLLHKSDLDLDSENDLQN